MNGQDLIGYAVSIIIGGFYRFQHHRACLLLALLFFKRRRTGRKIQRLQQEINEIKGVKKTQMSIQWYPGHMLETKNQLKGAVSKVDAVLEVLDARLPSASANPLFEPYGPGQGLGQSAE